MQTLLYHPHQRPLDSKSSQTEPLGVKSCGKKWPTLHTWVSSQQGNVLPASISQENAYFFRLPSNRKVYLLLRTPLSAGDKKPALPPKKYLVVDGGGLFGCRGDFFTSSSFSGKWRVSLFPPPGGCGRSMRGKSALRLDPRLGRMSHSVGSDMDGMGASLVPNSGEKEGNASLSFFSSKVLGTNVASEPSKEAASQ